MCCSRCLPVSEVLAGENTEVSHQQLVKEECSSPLSVSAICREFLQDASLTTCRGSCFLLHCSRWLRHAVDQLLNQRVAELLTTTSAFWWMVASKAFTNEHVFLNRTQQKPIKILIFSVVCVVKYQKPNILPVLLLLWTLMVDDGWGCSIDPAAGTLLSGLLLLSFTERSEFRIVNRVAPLDLVGSSSGSRGQGSEGGILVVQSFSDFICLHLTINLWLFLCP